MSTTAITFLFTLLLLELLFTAGSAAVLLLRRSDAPPAGRRMRWLWAAVLLISLIPLRVFTPTTSVTIVEEPVTQAVRIEFAEYETDHPRLAASPAETVLPTSPVSPPEKAEPVIIRLRASSADGIQTLLILLCSVWLIGAAASLIGRITERRSAAVLLRQHSAPCCDGRLLSLYSGAAAGLGIKTPPPLRMFASGMILSPCCSGTLQPSVYISEAQQGMSDDALSLIFTHELSHVRAHDPLLSLLCEITCSIHWINPLCERVSRAIAEDCELGCDEQVLRTCGDECRVPYIHAILDIASGVTAYAAEAGSFFAARSNRAEFLKRRYDSMKNKRSRRLTTALAVCMAVLLLCANMLALSSCTTTSASDSKTVTLQNPVLAAALAEYFGVAAEELTEYHMSCITSLEILPSGWEIAENEALGGIIPVRIRVNGGVMPTSAGEMEIVSIGTPYDDGFVFESLPLMIDKALMDPMFEAIRAQDEWNSMKFMAFYTLKDADEATLYAYAYDLLVRQFCEGSSAERATDEYGNILDVNGDGVVDDKDVSIIGTNRTYAEAEAIVAAMSEELRESYISTFMTQTKEEILAKAPYAEVRPMYLVDPECKPREVAVLLAIMQEAGVLDGRVLTGTAVDLADTALMPNLTSLTVCEPFTAVNAPAE